MKTPTQLFTEHPAAVGETYFEHMGMAFSFAFRMLGGGLACLLHGIFPFLFVTTGSQTIKRLHDRMVLSRVQAGKVPQGAGTAPQ